MEVLTEIAAEVLTEVDLVVVLALILNIVAVICKDSIHSLIGVLLLPYNN